jgi:hypothetical protein
VLIFYNPVGIVHETHGKLQLVVIFLRVNKRRVRCEKKRLENY